MTWKEFKQRVEQLGVTDETELARIHAELTKRGQPNIAFRCTPYSEEEGVEIYDSGH